MKTMTIKISMHPKVVDALVQEHGGIDIGEIAAMALNTRAAQLGILDKILAEENATLDERVIPKEAVKA
jgi:hypothetical protein